MKKIKSHADHPNFGFNASIEQFEVGFVKAGVIDPTKVTICGTVDQVNG